MLSFSYKSVPKLLLFIFSFLSLFTLPTLVKEIKAEECEWNTNLLDAKCKCERNQCRLSKTGNKGQFAESGANNDKNTGLLDGGSYDCFDGNTVLGKGDTNKQKPYKAIFTLPNQLDAYDPNYSNDPSVCAQLDREDVKRDKLAGINLRYVDPLLLNNPNEDPCYIFDGSNTDENGKPYDIPADKVESTESIGGGVAFSKIACGKKPIFLGVLQNGGCGYGTFFTPNPKDYTDTSNLSEYEFRKDCIIQPVDNGFGTILECGTSPNNLESERGNVVDGRNFYQKFYVDEFNRLPNNQNIPEEAICKSVGGPNDGYAYWYYPKFFELVGGGEDAQAGTCSPVLAKKDLFGRKTSGTPTFFGCLPNSVNGAAAFFVRLAVGIAGFITLLVAIINLLKIIGSSNNPDAITEARKKMVGAVITFIFLLSSITILSILGLSILDLKGIGGGIFSLFTGG